MAKGKNVRFVWTPWTDATGEGILGGLQMKAQESPDPFAVFNSNPKRVKYTTYSSAQISLGEWNRGDCMS